MSANAKISMTLFILLIATLISVVEINAQSVPATKADAKTDVYVRGLLALRGTQKHVSKKYIHRLVKEAKAVVAEPGNSWMPVHIMLGIAVMETDLRWWLKRGRGTVADCGLTQINLTSLSLSTYKKKKLCKALRKKGTGTKLSMQWTMKEMRRIKKKYCNKKWLGRMKKWHRGYPLGKLTDQQMFWRCALAVYNQGPQFLYWTKNTCRYRRHSRKIGSSVATKRWVRKCRNRNRYWLKAWCFSEGVRLGKGPKYAVKKWRRGGWKIVKYRKARCRSARSLRWIANRYRYVEDNVVASVVKRTKEQKQKTE